MPNEEKLTLTEHDLGGGLVLLGGRLPADLLWDRPSFEAAWAAHPAERHEILMHGRLVRTPRWQQAYGADYRYTGNVNRALPVPPTIEPLLAWARGQIDPRLNSALVNWYEGPGHYIGPHHDAPKQMVVGSPIVTVSFGETRTFRLTRGAEVLDFPATDGTVFVMPYDTNRVWKHGVPKSARYRGRRISVTFRAFCLSGRDAEASAGVGDE